VRGFRQRRRQHRLHGAGDASPPVPRPERLGRGLPARQCLKKDDTQSVHVGLRHGWFAAALLWGQIGVILGAREAEALEGRGVAASREIQSPRGVHVDLMGGDKSVNDTVIVAALDDARRAADESVGVCGR